MCDRDQRTVGKQVAKGQFQCQALTHLRNHAHGQQRMTAQLEETIMTPYALDLQQLAPDQGQCALQIALRGLIFAGRQRGAIGYRQGTAVDLAVGRQRPAFQAYQCAGHHITRQTGQQRGTQLLHGAGSSACAFSEVTHQPRLPRFVLASKHQCFLDTRQLAELVFDLTQLDTHPANFHLIVVTTQVFQRAIGIPARQIAGAVHARLWLPGERVMHKAFCSQLRLIQVTAGHTVATDIQLTRHPERNQLLALIKQINRRVGDRLADIQAAVG